MRNLILTAGKATRLGDLAPVGCKAMTRFRGRMILEWQLDVLGEATFVCRSEHRDLLKRFGPCVIDDSMRGPVHALYAALTNEPTTVVYADSYFSHLPDGDVWCATGWVTGERPEEVFNGYGMSSTARKWDVVEDSARWSFIPGDRGYQIGYSTVAEGHRARVCTGMYRFDDPFLLLRNLGPLHEGNMGHVLNKLHVPFVDEPSWCDVGDPQALQTASVAFASRTFPDDARVVMAEEQT